jgi:methionyl-tRNA formyltransferase
MSKPIKTIFFGTHQFATTILKGLIDSPLFEVTQVITQPDKPVGRKKTLTPPPVKTLALEYNIAVQQPDSLKQCDITQYNADIAIVAQYGKIIPNHILNACKHGTINTHTSLLPKYRGASPIQTTLINGDTTTGITIMKMAAGLDTGPIISQETIVINPDETYPQLDARLAKISQTLLIQTIPKYIDGSLKPIEQDDSTATTCKQLSREDGLVDWQNDADTIYNQYRGLTPWPGIWTTWDKKRLKLLQIQKSNKTIPPGKVLVEQQNIYIGTKQNAIKVLSLQLEGKKAMDTKVFLQGLGQIDGEIVI